MFQDPSFVFIYFLSEPLLFIRAAKDLLSRVQKKLQRPQESLKALLEEASSLLSNHTDELQAAEELLKETDAKTQESSLLLLLVKANLKEFNVSLRISSPNLPPSPLGM